MKNIKPFLGKPLIEWSIQAAQNCDAIDEIIISTDCDEISECVSAMPYSKVILFDRDPATAEDDSSTESAMLDFIHRSDCRDKDLLILMQATSPWTDSKDLDAALGKFEHSGCDSLLSAVPSHSFLWNEGGDSINYDYRNRPRRQDFEAQYQENGAFYINSIENILKYRNRLCGKICFHSMHKFSSLEIDDGIDWEMAEILMAKLLEIRES
jgi:N-acylneuraminate cytidylyltransferase